MSNIFNLIPQPATFTLGSKGVKLSSLKYARISGVDESTSSRIGEMFPSTRLSYDNTGYFIELSDGVTLDAGCVPEKSDAYTLTVTEHGARIDAHNAAGLFYGVQTLAQLPDDAPGLSISDYAAIPIRMIHWDLKGYLPRFDVLKDEMRILASYKVNALLLELEDKYDFKCAPGVGVEGAYTYEQLRELSILAKRMHIKIVPKLQSVAHVDYILKHDVYRPLRSKSTVFQFDVTSPEVKILWEAMCAELMDCFREHGEFFHIGADECSLSAKEYLHRVSDCVEYVCTKSWTPIMWDDIVRNCSRAFSTDEEALLRSQLGERCVFMYWAYGYGGFENELPFVKEYMNTGLRVWGASGYAGCDNWAGSVAPLSIRAKNIDAWTAKAVEYGLECVCATGWTRIGSADCPAEPQESCWATILYSASSMWNGLTLDYVDFTESLLRRFYNIEDTALRDVCLKISSAPYSFSDACASDTDDVRLRFIRCAAALEKLADNRTRLLNYFQYYDGKLTDKLEDYRFSLLDGYTETLIKDLTRYKEYASETFALLYEPVTVEEVLRTRFGYLEKLVQELLRQLKCTRLV